VKAEDYSERKLDIAGWQVNLTTYRIGEVYHCHADNVSPGANIARTTGSTREEAEQKALERAEKYLAGTKRHAV
jgi:hypothetical protein